MALFSTRELIVHKAKKLMTPIMAEYNRNKLNNTDFTIISNNCWEEYVMNILTFLKIARR